MFAACIIMAGGSGLRLWPESTSKKPKQFMALPQGMSLTEDNGRSFFSSSVKRALAVTTSTENPSANSSANSSARDGLVVIVAGKSHIDAIASDCKSLEESELKRIVMITEPMAKNTAAAIAFALTYIKKNLPSGSEDNILVLTSDHIIEPLDIFLKDTEKASLFARQEKLAVFGIKPDRNETGFGYIEAGTPLDPENSFEVISFHEKPDAEKAKFYVEKGNYFWNSGMFVFSLNFMLKEFSRNAGNVIDAFGILKAPAEDAYIKKEGLKILVNWENLEEVFKNTHAISFDYAIAEKCDQTVMIRADFSWKDVGSWDDYAKLSESLSANSLPPPAAPQKASLSAPMTAEQSAPLFGNSEALASCYVKSDIPVALWGVEDLIVVLRTGKEGPPVLMITKKGHSQGIREITEEIKNRGRSDLL